MERQFNKDDFEKLLRDNANQYRMYPSEKVWKGIHATLHSRRKWYGISALALLLLIGAGVSLFLLNNKQAKQTNAAIIKNNTPVINTQSKSPVSFSENENSITSNFVREDKTNLTKTKQASSIAPDFDYQLPATNYISNTEKAATIINANAEKIEENSTEVGIENGVLENESIESASAIQVEQENKDKAVSEKSEESIAEKFNPEKITDEKLAEAINAIASQNATIPVKQKQPKITAQVYFTPTVSYRTLTENKNPYANGLYVNTPVVDLNKEVKHKPAMGLEFGIEGKYRVNDRFYIKSGLQFNINRYDIRAYSHPTEIATIAVTSGFSTDSLASLSNYRNKGSAYANWLENFYFQAALPVGVEIILTERKNISWGISGTIQPTYVIGDRAYLISSDYKNYAKFPDLMRRWNLSTGIETFVAYSTGKIKWQAGPHMRYQHLSSFVSGYPVKENLFAVGIKVGATIIKKK